MLVPITFDRIEAALATRIAWVDLVIVLACVGIAWLVDRQLHARSLAGNVQAARIRGGVARVVFPLLALLLLAIARVGFRHWGGVPLFIDLAIPLLMALAAIRILLYGVRRLFTNHTWLKTSERAIGFTIWGMVVLWFTGVLPEITQELDNLTIPIGKSSVTVLTVGKGFVAMIVTLVITLWLSGLIEQRLVAATSLDTNLRAVLAKIVRAALLVVGVLFALDAIGFDLTLLTVFGGALGVGVGLGLQKLAANYIAGFTVLIDKSIRLGDLITVDNRYGVVTRVTSRYVVVRANDGVEAIVPNETLVTTSVLRHPHPSREFKLVIPLQVGYDTDIDVASRLMEEAALAEASALKQDRAPVVQLSGFGDSGIGLELVLWVLDPEGGHGSAKTRISRRILEAFRANSIEIPYPRRDIRLLGKDIAAPGRETA
jgi:small-conductance mechanosensitive channel